jgi:hemoglobin-like flavoprotein
VRTDFDLLNESLGLVAPAADELVDDFYDMLFAQHPHVRALFPADMTAQRERLLTAIVDVVTKYDRREELVPRLQALGRRHVRYGALPMHYDIVGRLLLAALRRVAGDYWTDEYDRAWIRAYTFAASVMLDAASAVPSELPEAA